MSTPLGSVLNAAALTASSVSPLINLSSTPSGTAGDVASEGIVESLIASLSPASVLNTVQVIATANIPGSYSGSSGPGDTFTVTATGTLTIDGVANPSTILLVGQSTAAQNGYYTLTTPGSTGVSPVLTRTTGYTSSKYIGGLIVEATLGTALKAHKYSCTNSSAITFGSTGVTFSTFDMFLNPSSGMSFSPTLGYSINVAGTLSCLTINGSNQLFVKILADNGLLATSAGLIAVVGDGMQFDGDGNIVPNLGNGLFIDTAQIAVNFADEATTIAKASGTAAVTPLGLASFGRFYSSGTNTASALLSGVTITQATHGLATMNSSGQAILAFIIDTNGTFVSAPAVSINQSTGDVTVTATITVGHSAMIVLVGS